MIVRQFLRWVQTAPAGDRAEATSALARAYLYSDLSKEDRLAAEAAMIVLLDDPSPLVRRALAEALQNADVAPHGVVITLVSDQRDIAEPVARRSPVLSDAELVDLVGGGADWMQAAIAARDPLSRAVAGAIAEVGCAQACLVLIENPYVDVTASALARIAERHGHLSAIREALFARDDLPTETRQALVAKLSNSLSQFVADRAWMPASRAQEIAREACDRATVALAAGRDADQTAALVRHLVSSGQLTGMLLLRALLSGNMHFLIEAFVELSGVNGERAARILSDRSGAGFRALYQKAGLPDAAFTAFRVALQAMHETGFAGDALGASMLKRRMIERVLTQYEGAAEGEVDFLFAMLRRLAAEAARDEARYYTADLIAAA
ncbi:MAG: DUF2336 domain-containing protein [Bradyrhizobiaceae bacterium]|nr:DUF2336 domain-containing protein [Bradyrhizobiaceae bacterium]